MKQSIHLLLVRTDSGLISQQTMTTPDIHTVMQTVSSQGCQQIFSHAI